MSAKEKVKAFFKVFSGKNECYQAETGEVFISFDDACAYSKLKGIKTIKRYRRDEIMKPAQADKGKNIPMNPIGEGDKLPLHPDGEAETTGESQTNKD
jgi:hypothetical protein